MQKGLPVPALPGLEDLVRVVRPFRLKSKKGRVGQTPVTESARACSYYSVSAGSNSGTPRLYHFWLYQFGCTSVFKSVLVHFRVFKSVSGTF